MSDTEKSNKQKLDEDISVTLAKVNQRGLISVARIGIITTLLTVVGGIAVALIRPDVLPLLFPNMLTPAATATSDVRDTATPPPPTSTLTVTPTITNTSTPSQPAATPSPRPTSIPGVDWSQNCIDLTSWTPYLPETPSPPQSSCAQLTQWGITAQASSLFINSLASGSTAQEYGISTSLPLIADIKLTINIKKLENSEVWIGILDASQPLQGYVLVIQPGASMDFRELASQKPIIDNQEFVYVDKHYPVTIDLDAGKVSILVNGNKLITDYPVPFDHRKLFIGYRSLPSTLIDVEIRDLDIALP